MYLFLTRGRTIPDRTRNSSSLILQTHMCTYTRVPPRRLVNIYIYIYIYVHALRLFPRVSTISDQPRPRDALVSSNGNGSCPRLSQFPVQSLWYYRRGSVSFLSFSLSLSLSLSPSLSVAISFHTSPIHLVRRSFSLWKRAEPTERKNGWNHFDMYKRRVEYS